MSRWSVVCGVVLCEVVLWMSSVVTTATMMAAEPVRVPDHVLLAKADQCVQSLYGRELKAANTPAASAALAARIVKVANEEKDPATRYALLQEARRQACDGLDAALGYSITKTIATDFSYAPENNSKPEDWIKKGDGLRDDARKSKQRKSEILTTRLLAAECYLRAYPNASGLNKALVEKKIAELTSDRRDPRIIELSLLIGTWDVQVRDVLAQWTFRPDGIASWSNSKDGSTGKGTWTLEPDRVSIQWDNGHCDSLTRPLSGNATGDTWWAGIGSVKARKASSATVNAMQH